VKLFSEGYFSQLAKAIREQAYREIDQLDPDTLLKANETDLIASLVEKHRLEPIRFLIDAASKTQREENRRGTYGGFTKVLVITFHIPCTGTEDLLRVMPSRSEVLNVKAAYIDKEIQYSVVIGTSPENAAYINNEFKGVSQQLLKQEENYENDVRPFNERLPVLVGEHIAARKAEILRQRELLDAIVVPMKKAPDVSPVFAYPKVERRTIAPTASTHSGSFKPEPTLDSESYEAILRLLLEVGREMERHPSTYSSKDEEALRDLFLLVLCPNFQSVTGETFNAQGKVDILVRHEGKNLFVAECKIWRGPKSFQEAIDQVLSYLTWRDSKAAILIFVQTKDFSVATGQICEVAEKHPLFGKSLGKVNETCVRFEFHLPQDREKGVRLTVLCFHFPAE
jgi:hypothetical protein